MSISIYVGNLPYAITADSLKEIFSEFGNVLSSRVITDKNTGRSKGFGFVEMETEEEANAAIQALDNGEIDGRSIRVNLAKAKEDRPRKFNNNRSGKRFHSKFGGRRDED
ncbi:MAG TPA: RNA-binding protein [Spirochaetota bacterium]|nr:RNA-binding protein [Spirochaetota bacterium]HOL58133.1 RNA-binding protein [Spirochaetota bacterium]